MSYKANCVTGTLHKMKILFIFWYEEVCCTINSTMFNWAIVWHECTQNNYSSNSINFAASFCKYFGPHCRDEKVVCSCYPSLCTRTQSYGISLCGGLFIYWKVSMGSCCIADWQATLCVQRKTSDILRFFIARLTIPVLVTQHTIMFYWLSYAKKLMVENTKSELVESSSHNGKAHLDLTWGLWAVRLRNIKCKVCSCCLQSVVH